jgi:hypothetical protein
MVETSIVAGNHAAGTWRVCSGPAVAPVTPIPALAGLA